MKITETTHAQVPVSVRGELHRRFAEQEIPPSDPLLQRAEEANETADPLLDAAAIRYRSWTQTLGDRKWQARLPRNGDVRVLGKTFENRISPRISKAQHS